MQILDVRPGRLRGNRRAPAHCGDHRDGWPVAPGLDLAAYGDRRARARGGSRGLGAASQDVRDPARPRPSSSAARRAPGAVAGGAGRDRVAGAAALDRLALGRDRQLVERCALRAARLRRGGRSRRAGRPAPRKRMSCP